MSWVSVNSQWILVNHLPVLLWQMSCCIKPRQKATTHEPCACLHDVVYVVGIIVLSIQQEALQILHIHLKLNLNSNLVKFRSFITYSPIAQSVWKLATSTIVLGANFQNDWPTYMDVMQEREFTRFDYKMNFGGISCIATDPVSETQGSGVNGQCSWHDNFAPNIMQFPCSSRQMRHSTALIFPMTAASASSLRCNDKAYPRQV